MELLKPHTVRVMFLCGADHLLQIGPSTIKDFGCVCVSRPGFMEELLAVMGDRYAGLVHLVEDDAVMSPALDRASSTRVRQRIKDGESVLELVGPRVDRYMREQRIPQKLRGELEWTAEDKDVSLLRLRPGY